MIDKLLQLTVLIGVASCIKVGPVRLSSSEEYITYGLGASETKSRIECPISLETTETIKEVSWVFTDGDNIVGRYFWSPVTGGKAEGRLKGVVRLDREDGDLELTELKYDLAGFYSCSATTEEEEEPDEAASWEVLIVDTTSNSESGGLDEDGCKFKSSFKLPAIYPQPTLHSGLYSESAGGFFEEVRTLDWYKQQHVNGSFSYSYKDVTFGIKEDTPHDVFFLNNVGISKKDGTYIPLFALKYYISEFEVEGCHQVKLDAYQKVEYSNGGKRTCRNEIRQPATGELKATVSCIDGYKAAGDSAYESLELTCNTKLWQWGISNDHPSPSHIKCILDDDGNTALTATGRPLLVLVCIYLLQFAL